MAKKEHTDNSWISFSDIMTGLMVIFLFISISYMLETKKNMLEIEKKTDKIDELVNDYIGIKVKLFNELDSVFKDDFKKWQVELDKDLSIKFTNPEILFESNQAIIKPKFDTILANFLPRYFDILLKPEYQNKISEIRIEGHTDVIPAPKYDKDPYIGNIKLSQLRSAEVLKYFRNTAYYHNLADSTEQKLQFWLTANGLSYGRTLDDNKQLTAISGNQANNEFSRRVEFRIITISEALVEQVSKEISK